MDSGWFGAKELFARFKEDIGGQVILVVRLWKRLLVKTKYTEEFTEV